MQNFPTYKALIELCNYISFSWSMINEYKHLVKRKPDLVAKIVTNKADQPELLQSDQPVCYSPGLLTKI